MSLTCGAPTRAGKRCGWSANLCSDCGRCQAHCQHRREHFLAVRRAGGKATARKHAAPGLTLEELGELRSHEDCERVLALISTAVATQRMDKADADACTRAIGQWLRARSDRLRLVELEKLKDSVARLEAEVDRLTAENDRLRAGGAA